MYNSIINCIVLPKSRFGFSFRKFFLLSASLTFAASLNASFFVSINSIGYSGAWQKFDSLSDAQNNTNALESGSVPQRDLKIYLSEGRVTDDEFRMATGWDLGAGNPSNDREGFVQIIDTGLTTVDSLSAGWTDSNFDTYQLNLTGSGAQQRFNEANQNQNTRLGVGPSQLNTGGTWHSYELNLNFFGLSSSEIINGIQRAADEPASVLGSLFILFENPNPLNLDFTPNANLGFYRVDLSINNVSWVVDNGVTEVVDNSSVFEAPTTPVPEVGAFALILSMLAGFWVAATRRLKK